MIKHAHSHSRRRRKTFTLAKKEEVKGSLELGFPVSVRISTKFGFGGGRRIGKQFL